MQLVILHRIMIATAILFCFGFGFIQLTSGTVALGAFFTVAGIALTVYLIWFMRKKVAQPEENQPSSRPPDA